MAARQGSRWWYCPSTRSLLLNVIADPDIAGRAVVSCFGILDFRIQMVAYYLTVTCMAM